MRLYKFLDAATQSLTTDTGFAQLKELASLGSSLKNIGLDNIQFLTVPNEPYEPDPNRLQLAPEAEQPVAQDPLRPAAGQARRRRGHARPQARRDPDARRHAPRRRPRPRPTEDAEQSEEQRKQAAEEAGLCV